jgi:DNA mismatch repair protein MutL
MLIEGGITKYENEIGFDQGTTLIVSDLFFNVPARAKFLRKARQETLEITNLVAIVLVVKVSFTS